MTDTVIAGAGIGGLATAALLARSGHRVQVFELQPTLADPATGILLQSTALAVLEALDALDDLAERGSEIRSLRLLDHRLHTIAEISLPGGPRFGYGLVVDRAEVQRALVEAATKAGAAIETGRPIVGLGSDLHHPEVRVGDEWYRCDLVVGADGASSLVRRAVGLVEASAGARRRYVRALIDWAGAERLTGEYWTRRGLAGLFPCGEGRTYLYATATSGIERAVADGDLAAARRLIAAAHPPLLQVVNAIESVDQIRIDEVRPASVGQLYRGAVVLIGDAAHSISPNLGQGANSALIDGAVLASELGRRATVADALAAYDARRCEVVRNVQRDAERLSRLAHLGPGKALRNAVMRLAPERLSTAAIRRAEQVDPIGFRAELRQLSE